MDLALDQTISRSHHIKMNQPAISDATNPPSPDPTERRVILSIVLPAYNEAQRLPPYLDTIRPYCRRQFRDDYEVIVVDDGSADQLSETVAAWGKDWPELKALRLASHRGKGAAVRAGMLAARGQLLLFADADGATPIEEAGRLRTEIERGADVAVGSRLVAGHDVRQQRNWWRGLLGRGFAQLVRALLRLPVYDTQCGFKMFRHDAGKMLFGLQREDGFLFDLELLILANQEGYRVVEVPVNWCEKSGGHFHWLREFWRVACGLRRLHGQRSALPRRHDARVDA